MGSISRFEDIDAWKKARELTDAIYEVTEFDEFSQDYGLKDQIRRASVSMMSNIAEGFERGGNQEFIQFLFQARASCAEVQSQLYVAKDRDYISEETFERVYSLAVEASKLISGFISYLRGSSEEDFRDRE
jgi:four helix bundle protein